MTSIKNNHQLDNSLDYYIGQLKAHGVKVNAKLHPAFFYLRNGLPYPGLLTSQGVNGHEELVKIPMQLILTAHRAMKQEELSEVFSNRFYKEGSMWQDRILVTYILYILSINKQCIWTQMAKMFSKDIDIISFWPEEQLNTFVDRSVLKAARKERAHFQDEWKRFEGIQQQYSIIKDKAYFNKQRYRWIYIHTISRCFGSFLKSTYFVPFCQLFNHNVVDVSYTCANEHKPFQVLQTQANNIQYQKMQQKEAEQCSQGSVSSGYSQDYVSDDDFDYMSINSYSIKWCSKMSFSLKESETKAVDKLLKDTYTWIEKELQLKGFTLIYLGQIIERLKIFENQYKAGRQKYQQTISKIEDTRAGLFAYRKHLVELYRSQGKEYQKIKNERSVETVHASDSSWDHFEKIKEECQQTYTHFKMEARDNAKFEANSQIYFSYGKLSNRTLLVRYGFSLEDNIYDHVWLKFQLGKHIQPYPDLFQLIQEKGLSVNYKVKLKSYTMALEPVVYFRVLAWKATHHRLEDIFYITDIEREMLVLERVKQAYLREMDKYKDIDQNLTDSSLGYHDYFTRVYNIGKKKILLRQLEQVDEALQILVKIGSKQLDLKTRSTKEFKHTLKHYLKGLRGLMNV